MTTIPEISPFKTEPICPKCGSDRSVMAHGTIEDGTESLKVTCERCGYISFIRPMDWGEQSSDSIG